MKVKQYKAQNQFHLYGDGKHVLQSYNSIVAEISGDYHNPKIVLGRDWDYSKTTSKYVYMFLEDYGDINFYNISNKRQYVRDLIKQKKIQYNEDLS